MVGVGDERQGGGIVMVPLGGELDVLDLGPDVGGFQVGVTHFATPTFLPTFAQLHHSK